MSVKEESGQRESIIIVAIVIRNLFSVDLTITFTKKCKANSRQPRV